MKNQYEYDHAIKPHFYDTFESYKKSSPIINLFYEKLLLSNDLMNKDTVKQIALKKHTFVGKFISHFFEVFEYTVIYK